MNKHLCLIFLVSAFILPWSANGQRSWDKKPNQFSIQTRMVLDSMYSHSSSKSALDFSTIGEASVPSKMFLLYSFLVSTATETELLILLADAKERSFIRGYAYMAYLYKCETEKTKEKPLTYNFSLDVRSGCITKPYTFKAFKDQIHSPRNYHHPKNIFIDNAEKEAINQENKLRKEQGLPLRKDSL